MKNKRWKREAKRMKGYCLQSVETHSCSDCKYLRLYCCTSIKTPKYEDIRKLERVCKNEL